MVLIIQESRIARKQPHGDRTKRRYDEALEVTGDSKTRLPSVEAEVKDSSVAPLPLLQAVEK